MKPVEFGKCRRPCIGGIFPVNRAGPIARGTEDTGGIELQCIDRRRIHQTLGIGRRTRRDEDRFQSPVLFKKDIPVDHQVPDDRKVRQGFDENLP